MVVRVPNQGSGAVWETMWHWTYKESTPKKMQMALTQGPKLGALHQIVNLIQIFKVKLLFELDLMLKSF